MSSLIDRSSTAVVGCSLIVIDSKPGERGVCPRVSLRSRRLGDELPNEAIFPRNANKLNLLLPLDTNRITKPLPAGRSVTTSPEFRMAHRGADQAAAGVALGV